MFSFSQLPTLKNLINPTSTSSVPSGTRPPASSSDNPIPRPSYQDQAVFNDFDPAIATSTAPQSGEKEMDQIRDSAEETREMSEMQSSERGVQGETESTSAELPASKTEPMSEGVSSNKGPELWIRLDLPVSQSASSKPSLDRRRTISGSKPPKSPIELPNGGTTYRPSQNVSNSMRTLSEMLGGLLRTQLKTQEARASLKNDRQSVADLDAQFMSKLRKLLATSPNDEVRSLVVQGENLIAARDEMFPKEDDYNNLEDQLLLNEFELQESIRSLLPRLEGGFEAQILDDQQTTLPDDGDEGLVAVASPTIELRRPELTEYLSCLGDATLAQERLDGLRRERAHLVEEKRVRSRYGLGLSEESREFLNNFDSRHEEYKRQVATTQLALDRIQGVLALDSLNELARYRTNPFDDQTSAEASALPHTLFTSAGSFLGPDGRSSRSASPARPVSPRDRIKEMQNPRLDPLMLADDDPSPMFPLTDEEEKGTIDIDTYIHQWLLNRLRRSSLEVLRFRSAEQLAPHNLIRNQPRDVIVHWVSQEERLDYSSSKPRGRATSTSIQPNTAVERSGVRSVRSDSVLPTIDTLVRRLHMTGPSLRMHDVVRENVSGHPNFLAQSDNLESSPFH